MVEKTPEPKDDAEHRPGGEDKAASRKALHEQQKRELPSNDWPGKGAH